jgi:hypothetical protein
MVGIKVVPTWAWLLAIAIAFVIGGFVGYGIGVDHEKAAQLDAAEDAAAQQDTRDRGAAAAGAATRAESGATQVNNEDQSHASQGRVQTIFRTVAVPADCALPDGVWAEINAATNAANGSVRAAAGAPAAAVPEG